MLWRKELAVDPPGERSAVSFHDDDTDDHVGIQSTLASAKESAMAVTGAPRSLPIVVDLPSSCAKETRNDKAATLPHESDCDMIDEMAVEVAATPKREVSVAKLGGVNALSIQNMRMVDSSNTAMFEQNALEVDS